uniref:ERBB receptor feedback inhibitor 1-like n=1 Tax=Oncorhynchus gorbuscha TaxID=8017 RepID=UPI001EAEA5A0|nr:ERBB receptor feedback inhibitor 1-like [Oncorhynchus gorbuscha]XP_046199495.1 ERBB receptor feedback inhibitor 1-like [Oncorhynchus gorbuscha]
MYMSVRSSLPSPSLCHSMARNKAYWGQPHGTNSLCFSLDADDAMEHNLREHHQHHTVSQGFDNKMPQPYHLLYSSSHPLTSHSTRPRPPEGDQVVPSFQRLSVYEQSPSCGPKPLPPLPDPEDNSSDEAADSEVEFFIDDRQHLLPQRCSTNALALHYGATGRRSFRGCGQVNYAYLEGPPGASGLANGGAQSGTQEQQAQFGGQRGPGAVVVAARDISSKQPDRPQWSKLRRSHSGPASSFKPSGLRQSCHLHHHHHGSYRGNPQLDKPEVPPRIPIPPRPSKTVNCHRWSVTEDQDKDKPPKVPPRKPIAPPCGSCCTPSPKSLPIYVNGVMPPTQSFAPNPKYVSKGLQRPQQQHREGSTGPMVGPRSPCIVPIMEDGRKASATHYFLLPRRPSYMDRLEMFLREKEADSVQQHSQLRVGLPEQAETSCHHIELQHCGKLED